MRSSQARDKPPAVHTDLYNSLHSGFGWQVPDHFNIAEACMRRWAERPATATRTAVIACAPGRPPRHHRYSELMDQANRLSNALAALGVQRGDRVAIVLPQRFETAVAYMAVLQMGAVGMPLSQLFGPDALEYRLHDSEAVVAICDQPSLGALLGVRERCPLLRVVIGLDGDGTPEGMRADLDWTELLAQEPADFTPVNTHADEAAVLIYTSGTTGNPKGALVPHRALIGNLSGFVCSQNWFGFDPFDAAVPSRAVFWSPADWAW
uniref:AMP-binding protein n=1 Tax=Hydrogenophaga sp. TaxID=1904254 RepID=UPI002FCA86CD